MVARYTATPVPNAAELRMLNRMGTGYTPAQLGQLRRIGGPMKWFRRQLRPGLVPENPVVAQIDGWFADRNLSVTDKWATTHNGGKSAWHYSLDLASWSLLRRTYSQRVVFEQMAAFFSDHLHVPSVDGQWPWRSGYDAVIRKHALGRFEDMLVEASMHPAMLIFLNTYQSTAEAPNENHGRELLELHTVGRAARYTEAMVRDSAKILSGWSLNWDTGVMSYQPRRHATGPVRVLGFYDANANPDGRAVATRYLRYLAQHPSTAWRLALKLCQRFHSERPPQTLVSRVAAAYRNSRSDIKSTLLALVTAPEFAKAPALVRTPDEELVATARALGPVPTGDSSEKSMTRAFVWQHSGERVFMWPRPDGPPRDAATLATPARIIKMSTTHWDLAGGWWPTVDVRYRPQTSWLPAKALRFDLFVDHLCRVLLGRVSTDRHLRSCMTITGLSPSSVITPSHEVLGWMFPSLVGSLLDCPEHMTR